MACRTHHAGDGFRIGGDHQAITHAQLGDATYYPEDEGVTCQRQEGLLRKAARAEPGRNDAQERHRPKYKSRAAASRPLRKPLSRSSPASAYPIRSPPTPGGIARHTR